MTTKLRNSKNIRTSDGRSIPNQPEHYIPIKIDHPTESSSDYHPSIIPHSSVQPLLAQHPIDSVLQSLLPYAQRLSCAPISKFHVGAVGMSSKGNIYLGANIEFPNQPLSASVHGEQFVTAHMFNNFELDMKALALTAPPCGHCRQFLRECYADDKQALEILIKDKDKLTLAQLLPHSFSPSDLGNHTKLLDHPSTKLRLIKEKEHEQHSEEVNRLVEAAIKAAERSYTPYTHSPSGCAIKVREKKDDEKRRSKVYVGSYLENAAYNPSLPPMQGALIELASECREWEEIEACVLVEKKGVLVKQEDIGRTLIKAIAPNAEFIVRHVEIIEEGSTTPHHQ